MSNNYDKIIKENIEPIVIPLLQKILNKKFIEVEKIDLDLQKTVERKVDFLRKVKDNLSDKPYILHIEFQSNDSHNMAKRMLEYYAFIYRKFDLPVEQYVIFLGKKPSKMITSLSLINLDFKYNLISTSEIDYQVLLNSEHPEEILWAILCNFKEDKPEKAVENIIFKIKNTEKDSLSALKYFQQLGILSALPKLTNLIVKKLRKMSIEFDIKNNILFKEGKEEGKEEIVEIMKKIDLLLKENKLNDNEIAEKLNVSLDLIFLVKNFGKK